VEDIGKLLRGPGDYGSVEAKEQTAQRSNGRSLHEVSIQSVSQRLLADLAFTDAARNGSYNHFNR
jgi:hypothetical protein